MTESCCTPEGTGKPPVDCRTTEVCTAVMAKGTVDCAAASPKRRVVMAITPLEGIERLGYSAGRVSGEMIWLVILLEHLEALFATLGLPHLAGIVCHLAVDFGMIGPCQPS